MRGDLTNVSLSTNINVPTRLRRAIHLDDLVLVRRIVKNHPTEIQNPDLDDNGNTSLHLATILGLLGIAQFLVDAGHENNNISRNANGDTPLHLAVEKSAPIATFLAYKFPHCIPWKNKQGADAVMLSARTLPSSAASPQSPPQHHRQQASTASSPQLLLTTLVQLSPVPASILLSAADNDGNTALHYASAHGQLKAIRALLAAGANPGARNAYSWTPIAYSSTVQAEVYFRGLAGGGSDAGGGGTSRRETESGSGLMRSGGGVGLRIVRTGEEIASGADMRIGDGRRRAGSAE
ncbi:MAG: hypothetical protein Q9219_001007 [cf. Caloplaca sp. 3 TL-2023]